MRIAFGCLIALLLAYPCLGQGRDRAPACPREAYCPAASANAAAFHTARAHTKACAKGTACQDAAAYEAPTTVGRVQACGARQACNANKACEGESCQAGSIDTQTSGAMFGDMVVCGAGTSCGKLAAKAKTCACKGASAEDQACCKSAGVCAKTAACCEGGECPEALATDVAGDCTKGKCCKKGSCEAVATASDEQCPQSECCKQEVATDACCAATVAVCPAGTCCAESTCTDEETMTVEQLEHLDEAATHLAAAGLLDEAEKVRHRAERQRQELVKQQAAELARLQGELEELHVSRPASKQVALRVQVLEVSLTSLNHLGFAAALFNESSDSTNGQETIKGRRITLTLGDPEGIRGLVSALQNQNLAKELASATLLMLDGQPASFTSGGSVATPVVRPDKSIEVKLQDFGTRIDAALDFIAANRVRLAIHPKVTQLDPYFGMKAVGIKVPGLRVQEIETGFDMELGQTAVLGGQVQQRVTAEKHVGLFTTETKTVRSEVQTLFLVTPELIDTSAPAMAKLPKANESK